MPWVSLDEGCGLALLHRDELPLESSARTGSTGYRMLERRVVILGPFPAGPARGGAMSLPDACWPTGENTSGKFKVRRVAQFGARYMLEYNPSGGH
jgi:hypothetical protein